MSLINQMLQDLEARGKQGQTVAPMPSAVRPVLPAQRNNYLWVMVLGLAVLLLVVVVWVVPAQLRGNHGIGPQSASVNVAPAAPVPPALVPGVPAGPAPAASSTGVATAPSAPVVAAVPAAPPAATPSAAAAAPSPPLASPSAPQVRDTPAPLPAGTAADAAPVTAAVTRHPGQDGAALAGGTGKLTLKLIPELISLARLSASGKPRTEAAPAAEPAYVDVGPVGSPPPRPPRAATAKAAPPVRAAVPDVPDAGKLMRQPLTAQQRSESEYRKALQAQQQGRQQEAVALLEGALQIDSQNTVVRQTLVAWLLEQGQRPEAVRRLQEGLGHDPAQAGFAMILARLQVDQGDVKGALETLNRSLPYTLGRADYQAFIAALLQREGRHKEAILRYQNALQLVPENAVWWMGMGISLQAEHQKPAARDAFQRAKANPGLSPELQAFVEQRISQLQ